MYKLSRAGLRCYIRTAVCIDNILRYCKRLPMGCQTWVFMVIQVIMTGFDSPGMYVL